MKNYTIQYNEKTYLDLLRIISALAVIVIHLASDRLVFSTPNSFEWQSLNLLNSISRFCVPVFVMISGALFLEKKYHYYKVT